MRNLRRYSVKIREESVRVNARIVTDTIRGIYMSKHRDPFRARPRDISFVISGICVEYYIYAPYFDVDMNFWADGRVTVHADWPHKHLLPGVRYVQNLFNL